MSENCFCYTVLKWVEPRKCVPEVCTYLKYVCTSETHFLLSNFRRNIVNVKNQVNIPR